LAQWLRQWWIGFAVESPVRAGTVVTVLDADPEMRTPSRRKTTMRSTRTVTSLSIAAILLAGAPALAQTSTDKPSITDQVEQKTGQTADKIKDAAQEAKAGLSDSWITSKAKIALFADDRVKGRQVHVETKDGVVMLRGKVDSADAKTAAADVAKGIDGAKSVKNELQVVPPAQRAEVTADDKVIAQNVESKLKGDPQLKNAKIAVNNGVVSLTGEVKSIEASAKASEVARSVAGVRSVKNDLTYASRSSLR
jgi:hyperosmotically inducible periplasmic protein